MPIADGVATDRTNGTGTFPGTSGASSIALPANTERQWIYVQNRDVGEVQVAYSGNYANGGSGQFAPIALNPASTSGTAGQVEDRDCNTFMPAQSVVTITGTAGQKVTVLTA